MKILKIITLLFLVSAASGFVYWHFLYDSQSRKFNSLIKEQIAKGKYSFPLKDVVPFEWQEVCAYLAYGADLSKNLNSEHHPLSGYKIIGEFQGDDDGSWTLVFKDKVNKNAYLINPGFTFRRQTPEWRGGCSDKESIITYYPDVRQLLVSSQQPKQ